MPPLLSTLADRLVAALPTTGGLSRGDAENLLHRHGSVSEKQVAGAIALAAARGQIVRLYGGTVIARSSR